MKFRTLRIQNIPRNTPALYQRILYRRPFCPAPLIQPPMHQPGIISCTPLFLPPELLRHPPPSYAPPSSPPPFHSLNPHPPHMPFPPPHPPHF